MASIASQDHSTASLRSVTTAAGSSASRTIIRRACGASLRGRVVRTVSTAPGSFAKLSPSPPTLPSPSFLSAAADWSRYPVGTTFKIKGLPHLYVVDDYGSSLVGTNTIDIYHPTLRSMNNWGTRDAEIHIVRWGSWERTANLLRKRLKVLPITEIQDS